MEEKNVALLGFISEATNYLKDKIDDSTEIKELNEADLEKIKNDLSKKISFSFDNANDKANDLIDVGRKAFDEFIGDSSDDMIGEFADIFNVDFKKENDEKDEKMVSHLLKILKEPKKNEESNELEDIILKVSSNADNDKEIEKLYKDNSQDKEIDSIFNEIIAHETFEDLKEEENINDDNNVVVEETIPLFEDENKEPINKEEIEEDSDRLTSSEFRNILEDVLGNVISKINEAKEEIEEEVKEDAVNENVTDEDITSEEVFEEKNEASFEDILDNKLGKEEIDVQSDHEAVALIKDILSNLDDNIEKEKVINIESVDNEDIIDEENNDEEALLEEENVEETSDDNKEAIIDASADIKEEDIEESNDKEDESFKTEETIDNNVFIDNEEETFDDTTIDDVEEASFDEDLDLNDDEVVEENIVDEGNEEEILDNENSFVNNDYIEDYNNRSLDEIYIANPGLEALEKSGDHLEEDSIIEENGVIKEDEENLNDENLEDSIDLDTLMNETDENLNVTGLETTETETKNDYLTDLINTLNSDDFAKKIEENKRKEEELKSKVYDSIREIYPYLSNGFIKGVYDLKEVFASEYKENKKIVILHRLVFEDIDGLRKFVEVMISHNYLINADENKMIVDVFKEHVNADGKILTDIFEVANQAKYLTGEYDGYRVIKEEEVA